MTEPTFGISIRSVNDQALPVAPGDLSTIGLLFVAADADVDVSLFPAHTPVEMNSGDATMIAGMGDGDGYQAVLGINSQMKGYSARMAVVRVPPGVNEAATIAAIVGDIAQSTGLHAFREAGDDLGFVPRLILIAGDYTGVMQKGVSVAIGAAGNGGTDGTFPLTFSSGTGAGASGTFTVQGGAVVSVSVNPGVYTVKPNASVGTASAGLTGATLTTALIDLAPAAVATLSDLLDDLGAHAFVAGPNTTSAAAKTWRAAITSGRIIPLDNGHVVPDGESTDQISPAVRFTGAQAQLDAANRGVPSKVVANVAAEGIVGLSRKIRFSITDGATDGQDLLAHQIGVTVRGSTADGALADSGFLMVALDNAGDDPLWRPYQSRRIRDYIHLSMTRSLRGYLGRYGLTSQTIQSVLNTTTQLLSGLQANGDIIDFRVGFDRDQNAPDNLRAGKFSLYFKAEETPILRKLDVTSYRYAEALDTLLDSIAA